MKKQVLVFLIIMVTLLSLAQVLFSENTSGWQILIHSVLAGILSTLLFWAIIKKRAKR